MPIRLWPNDYVKKEHITPNERFLLRNAEKNFKDGHFAVDIDPVRMCNSTLKMGMYLSPLEGLVTYSLFPGEISEQLMEVYINHVQTIEDKIYERLLDSKILIIRAGEYKVLKFPYKHMILFQNVRHFQQQLHLSNQVFYNSLHHWYCLFHYRLNQ